LISNIYVAVAGWGILVCADHLCCHSTITRDLCGIRDTKETLIKLIHPSSILMLLPSSSH